MSEAMTTSKDKTFAGYSKDQGKAYAQFRLDYDESVYRTILDHHAATGGGGDTLLDIGCGPGFAARRLAPHFANVLGLDPSEGMIAGARSLAESDPDSMARIRFELSSAEELGSNLEPPVGEASVDLITAATCAHWFDMDRFWPQAARVLRPGGSVALWASGEMAPHPDVPNAGAIAAVLRKYREEHLLPFYEEGNLMTLGLYANLPLPWTLQHPVAEFDEGTFFRKEWDGAEPFHKTPRQREGGLDLFEKVMGTTSPVTRWREAHPDLAGTERDVIRMCRREIEQLLQEAGVEKGQEVLRGLPTGVLLIVKKKAK